MNRGGKLFCGLILLGLAPIHVESDAAPGAAAPESTAAAYFETARVSDHDGMAGLMHPQALEDVRRMMLPLVEEEVAEKKTQESLRLFADVKTVAQLRALDRRRFFASFYRGVTESVPQMREMMVGSKAQILGHVMEGDSLAHVVYRIQFPRAPVAFTQLTALTLKRTRSGWGVMLTGEMQGMLEAVRQMSGISGAR